MLLRYALNMYSIQNTYQTTNSYCDVDNIPTTTKVERPLSIVEAQVISMEPIIEVAKEANVKFCHVEQDHSPHPLKSIQQSMEHLKTL